jgi:hypothetical protein
MVLPVPQLLRHRRTAWALLRGSPRIHFYQQPIGALSLPPANPLTFRRNQPRLSIISPSLVTANDARPISMPTASLFCGSGSVSTRQEKQAYLNRERLHLASHRAMQLNLDVADFRQAQPRTTDSETELRIGERIKPAFTFESWKTSCPRDATRPEELENRRCQAPHRLPCTRATARIAC